MKRFMSIVVLIILFVSCKDSGVKKESELPPYMKIRTARNKVEDSGDMTDNPSLAKEELLRILQELEEFTAKFYTFYRVQQIEVEYMNLFRCLAQSCAEQDNKKDAIFYLQKAVYWGLSTKSIERNEVFKILRDHPEFQEIMNQARANDQFWDSEIWQTPFREDMTTPEKIAGISRFWSEVKYNFSNFDLVPSLDWDALYVEYVSRIIRTKSTYEYFLILQEMCAKLNDSHTNVYPPEEISNDYYGRPAIKTVFIEDRVFIADIYDEESMKKGIEPGMEISEIDGQPVNQYVEEKVIPYLSSSTHQDLMIRAYEYFLFTGCKGKSEITLTLINERHKISRCKLRRLPYDEYLKVRRPRKTFEFKILTGKIAYIALRSFSDPEILKEFENTFTAIKDSKALIIDIRDNGGGDSWNGYNILKYLSDKPFQTSRAQTRVYRPIIRVRTKDAAVNSGIFDALEIIPHADPQKLYKNPVIVLSGARTFSAAEDFLVAFKLMNRGKIIGGKTGGSTGQPLFFKLPGGCRARVCVKRDTFPDGKDFVGIGIIPDIEEHQTTNDFRRGRDTVLETALKYIRAELNEGERK